MSWREFRVLLDGLSPFGAVATHYKDALQKQKDEEAQTSNGPPADVNDFWGRMTSFIPKVN